MNVYTVILRRISTGEVSPSFLVRKQTEAEARVYAEAALKAANEIDLEVAEIQPRTA
jgi:hypothetical protein